MKKTAGIKPLTKFSDKYLGALKQTILLFDKIGIPSLNHYLTAYKEAHQATCKHWYIVNEVEQLIEKDLLFDSMPGFSVALKKGSNIPVIAQEFKELSNVVKGQSSVEIKLEAAARLSALMQNNEDVERDYVSIPLISTFSLPNDIKTSKAQILNLIIEKMPIPNDSTPWENVFEFKSNPDNIGRFAGLRTWINKSVNSGLTLPEIADELDHLLYLYTKSLELHKIKHSTGLLETIVVGTAEVAENVARLKFSDIAKGLFSAKQSKIDLLNSELTSPGNELSYIYKARETFK